MLDLVFLVLAVALFATSALYVHACASLVSEPAAPGDRSSGERS